MKHVGFSSVLLLLAIPASASVLLSDRFNYPDGPLSQAAGSAWVNHGGTPQQLSVSDGSVRLTQLESEDVSAPLPGGPYNQGVLYASFVVNVGALPSGDGGFFFHFKDGGSTQKARVFVSTNGVAPGRFKFGIANGSAAVVYVDETFLMTTSHRLVVRYQAGSPTSSTLWIDPTGEVDTARRAEASDVNRTASINSVALRQSLASGDGMGTLALDDLVVGTEFGDVAGLNTPPTISRIADQHTGANQPVGPIPFRVEDAESEPGQLRVTLSSSNPEVLSAKGAAFQGTGVERSLRLAPNPDAQGVADVTLTVSDGVKSAASLFRLTVGAPSLAGPGRVEIPVNGESGSLEFLVSDRESQPEQLAITAQSSNTKLFPPDSIHWSGRASSRLLSLRPAADQSGISEITVVLTDGIHTLSNRLSVTVHPQLGVVLSEPFSSVDGSLIDPTGAWTIHAPDGGSPTNIVVQSGHLRLSEKQAEDVSVLLKGGPYAEASGTILYAALRVRCLDLPAASGGFFAHFRDDRSGFRGRLYLAAKEAPAGHFRFGVASGAESPVYAPYAAAVGEDVTLVLKQNLTTGRAQLWLNPTGESDPSVVAGDEAVPIKVSNWSFRQADGIGELWVDSVRVAASFAEALGESVAEKLEFSVSRTGLELSWAVASGAIIEHRASLGNGAWTAVLETPREENGRRVLTVPTDEAMGYYRLVTR
jgi:hypothetical protein